MMNRTIFSRIVLMLAGCVFLSACSAHSPFILKTTTDSTPAQTSYPSFDGKVFVTSQSLPSSIAFDSISRIDVGTIWYGSPDKALALMADRARELGANAVINAKTWRQPSGFSWAAPEASGVAVHIKDIKAIESSGVTGNWY
jgi:hypothetical protein